MSKKIFVCKECGSEQVFSDAFVGINDPKDIRTFDAKHCEICEGECSVVTKKEFEAAHPEGAELFAWRKQLFKEIAGLGFDNPDRPVSGSSAVEYLGKLFEDLRQMVGA